MTQYVGARREPGQVVAVVVAAVFVVASVLDLGSGVLDNLVHLGFGLTGLAMSRAPHGARAFLIFGGVAYVILWQYGTVIDPSLVPFHTSNMVVHLSLVASMIGLAVLSGSRRPAPVASDPEDVYEVEIADVPDAPAGVVRVRPSRNRPPGRDDRRTASRLAGAGRPRIALTGRAVS
jgi:uncharacterized protein DUF4383